MHIFGNLRSPVCPYRQVLDGDNLQMDFYTET